MRAYQNMPIGRLMTATIHRAPPDAPERVAVPRRWLRAACLLALLNPALSSAAAPKTPRWTLSAEALVLGRGGSGNQALISLVPGDVPWLTQTGLNTSNAPGIEALGSHQLGQPLAVGPKVGLTYRASSGYGFELSYSAVLGLSGKQARGPETPGQWLVMKAPGSFWQTQDFAYQGMAWQADTRLHSLEANARRDVSQRLTLLLGLRWLRLDDTLQGTLSPLDFGEPEWKLRGNVPLAEAVPVPGSSLIDNPPFWTTSTVNRLYGAQIGARARVVEAGRLSVEASAKAGLYANRATQTAEVSLRKQLFPAAAAANGTSFVGEGGLVARLQVDDHAAFRLGYNAIWLQGVALAPAQIRQINTTPTGVSAAGIDSSGSTLLQGLTFGIEVAF